MITHVRDDGAPPDRAPTRQYKPRRPSARSAPRPRLARPAPKPPPGHDSLFEALRAELGL